MKPTSSPSAQGRRAPIQAKAASQGFQDRQRRQLIQEADQVLALELPLLHQEGRGHTGGGREASVGQHGQGHVGQQPGLVQARGAGAASAFTKRKPIKSIKALRGARKAPRSPNWWRHSAQSTKAVSRRDQKASAPKPEANGKRPSDRR